MSTKIQLSDIYGAIDYMNTMTTIYFPFSMEYYESLHIPRTPKSFIRLRTCPERAIRALMGQLPQLTFVDSWYVTADICWHDEIVLTETIDCTSSLNMTTPVCILYDLTCVYKSMVQGNRGYHLISNLQFPRSN